jgi:WD40 repeat protein/energy-coupling factor transporter ATP-binding protein EcfA2
MEIEYDIFISFKNSDESGKPTKDREIAYRLYKFLKSKKLKIFFSEATLEELGADSWGDEIEDALRASKIFIALSTKKEYFYYYWLQRERTTFLTLKRDDKSKAIYSYIAPPITIKDLPDDIKGFECFEDTKANEFERLYSFISKRLTRYFYRINNEYIDENLANPYKGLSSFTYEDRENYYGREEEVKSVAKVIKNSNFFTLFGASGSGKSSFLFAGILPLIKDKDILTFRPLENPFKSFASLFIHIFYRDELEQLEKISELEQKLKTKNISFVDILKKYIEKKNIRKLYMIIDQFEELFTLTKEIEVRNIFLNQLIEVINSSISISIIISIRSDFLSQISYHTSFNDIFNQYPSSSLGILSIENLKDVIEKPALKFGVKFQEGLVDRVVDEVAKQIGQLPLLEFALYQLWKSKEGRVISFKSLEKIGGVTHSISQYADDIYSANPKYQKSMERIFINLISIGRGTEDTKRVARLDEFREEDRETITLLADNRLVITDNSEVEIVHEALIREWKRLKSWINKYRDFLQWQERVREDRTFYEENGKKNEDLLRDSKLLVSKDFLESHKDFISDRDKSFIERSIEVQRKRENRKRMLLGGIFLSLLVVIGVIGYFWNTSEEQKSIAREAQIKTKSLLFENTLQQGISYKKNTKNYDNLLKAKSIFAKAISLSTNEIQENKSKLLYSSINIFIQLERILLFNTRGLVFDKNREIFLSLEKNKVVLFNLRTNKKSSIIEHNTSVIKVFLSNDESEILSWDKHTVKIWNKNKNTIQNAKYKINIERVVLSKNRKYVIVLGEGKCSIWNREKNSFLNLEHNSSIESACFDDEKFVLSWDDKIIKIWNIDTNKLIRIFEVQKDDSIENVVFDTRGNILIYRHKGEDDISIRAYNIKTGKKKFETKGYFLGFNEDKRKFITVENQEDGTFEIRDTETGLKINSLSNGGYTISHFVFNKKMNAILLVNNKIFNIDGGEVQLIYLDDEYNNDIKIEYPKSYVIDAFLTPNEKYIISWSPQEIIIFDIENNKIISSLKNNEPIDKVVFNQKRNQIISWSEHSIKFWSIKDNKKRFNLNKYETNYDYDVKYTKNGKGMFFRRKEVYTVFDNKKDEELQKIAEDYYNYTVRFIDLTNNEIIPIIHHKARVNGIVISADETQLLSYSEDNTSKLFDLKRKKILFTLKHKNIINANFSKNRKYILSWSSNGSIILWNCKDGKKIFELKDNSNNKNNFFNRSFGANISEDSKQIYSFFGNNIIIWDIKTKKQKFNFKKDGYVLEQIYNSKHYNKIQGAILSRDNTKIMFWYNTGVLNSKYMLYVWDIKNKKKLMSYKFKNIDNAIFTNDMKKILCWGYNKISLLDINIGKKIVNFKISPNLNDGYNLKIKFDEKEKFIFAKNDDILNILDVETGELLFETEDNRDIIWNNTDLFLSKIYNKKLNNKYYPLKMEVELGIYLNKSGEIKVLSKEEWEEKKRRYDEVLKENE